MGGIQEYLYKELYALFYRFCLAGTEAAKADIIQKLDEIEKADDIFPNEEKKKAFQQMHQRCEKEINEERMAAGGEAIPPLVYDSTDHIIDSHIKKQNIMKREYENRVGHRNFRIEQRSYLMILKGFSSSTPFL